MCYACQGPDCETLLREYSKLDIDDFSQGQIDDSVKETADFFGVEPNDGSILVGGNDGNLEIDKEEFKKFALDENGNVTMIPVLYCSKGCLVGLFICFSMCLSKYLLFAFEHCNFSKSRAVTYCLNLVTIMFHKIIQTFCGGPSCIFCKLRHQLKFYASFNCNKRYNFFLSGDVLKS